MPCTSSTVYYQMRPHRLSKTETNSFFTYEGNRNPTAGALYGMPQVDKATFLPTAFWIFVYHVGGSLFLNSTYLYTFVLATKLNFRRTTQKLAFAFVGRRATFVRPPLPETLYKLLVNVSAALLGSATTTPLRISASTLLRASTPFWGLQPVEGGADFSVDPSAVALRAYYERLHASTEQISAYTRAYESCTDLAELERIEGTYGWPIIELLQLQRSAYVLYKKISFDALQQSTLGGEALPYYTAEHEKIWADLAELNDVDLIPQYRVVCDTIELTLQYHEEVLPYNKVVFALAQEAGFLTYSLCTDRTTAFGGYVTLLLVALLLICFFGIASARYRYRTPCDSLPNLTGRPFYLWPFASGDLLLTSGAVLVVIVLQYRWKLCFSWARCTLLRTSHRRRKRRN